VPELIPNPFCTRFVRPGAIEYVFAPAAAAGQPTGPESIADQLLPLRRGLILGPHGSGKSTLVRTLLPQLRCRFTAVDVVQTHASPSRTWQARAVHARRLARATRDCQTKLPRGGLLVVDGLEQLHWLDRRRLIRAAARSNQWLLGTGHQPLGGFHTIFQTVVTAELLLGLTESLLQQTPSRVARPVRAELQRRDLCQVSDVRGLWFDLYDVAQSQSPCSHVRSGLP
jgi:hypothetical protein